MKPPLLTRRKALAGFAKLPQGIAPRADLANVLEFENMAERRLPPLVYAGIAGGDREFFDRITFRPRLMVPTTRLDLSIALFGEKMFAPIMVGPIARLQTYHPDGEVGMARAAAAAKSWMVVSEESSMPLEKIAAESKTPLWFQVFPEAHRSSVRAKMDHAVQAGCKALVITVGARRAALNWSAIDAMREGIGVPVLIKGIMTPQEAETAVKRGIQGIVVSNYGGLLSPGLAPPIEMLPAIADAVSGQAPILIDGGFRRGSDIFKALAYGATAVMLGRPPVWGLAAYGPEGAQQVIEMLQTEVARVMAHCGKQLIGEIDRTVVKLHQA